MFTSKRISPEGRAILITGSSTGLGRETALLLANQGFRVFAGIRNAEDGEKLRSEAAGSDLRPIIIDVTDETSISTAIEQIAKDLGDEGLWGLVNNAGICISAPLECVSSDLMRMQLEVNLIGQLSITRAALPLLRKGTAGRLINMTSGLGSVAIPYLGAYSAAQFAKESMSDALRRELAPMGIKVTVVSPGAIWTPIWGKVAEEGTKAIDAAPSAVSSLYRETFLRFLNFNEQSARTSATKASDVAQTIFSALTLNKPKTRYRIGKDVRRGAFLAWLLPDERVDKMFLPIVTPPPAPKE